ncbi:HCP-like protein [Backusella circina FSU 941]|nr:HCP-like protein [Backusella circina FSU 941]
MCDTQQSMNDLNIDPDILRKAWEGDSHAQLQLGEAYFAAVYVEHHVLKAFDWILRSAEQGNMAAQFRLGDLYSLGHGAKQSHADAYKWYIKAAIQGYKKGRRRLHNLYQEDKKMYCRGKLNAEEELRKKPDFPAQGETYYRELFEQRLGDQKQKLNNITNYFSERFQEYKLLYQDDQDDPDVQVNLAFLYQYGYGILKVEGRAIEYYIKAASQGHHDAQYNLGYLYQKNTDIKFNYRRALKWYTLSAQGGNIAGQNALAYFYEKGLATDIDYEIAHSWYVKAAEGGNSDAQLTLGKWYRKGERIQRDLSEAVKWYRLAAKQGNGAAQSCLNQLCRNGIDVHHTGASTRLTLGSKLLEDIIKLTDTPHFTKLKKLAHHARRTDGQAMFEIGLKYYHGVDFTQDKDTGFQWIKKAAKARVQEAEQNIAQMYEEGDDVDQDYHESSKWVRKSAGKKNSQAQCKLGTFFKNGLGVRKDPLEASKWFTFSADQGNSDGQYQFGLLKLYGEGLRKDAREAISWFYKSALSANPSAIFIVGELYENGDYEMKNEKRAIHLYNYAARNGNTAAQNRLGQIYEEGILVDSDLRKAKEYYTMASDSGNEVYQVNLAIKYLDGVFMDMDYIKVFYLIKDAADKNHQQAMKVFQTPLTLDETSFNPLKIIDMFKFVSDYGIENLDYNIGYAYEYGIISYSELDFFPIDYKSAESWYSTGANNDDSRAQYRLGLMYEEGKGVEKNLEKALSYYLQAHKNGNSNATYSLAQIYLNGNGVNQDLTKAFFLFTEASEMGHIQAHKALKLSNSSLHNNSLKMLENIGGSGNVATQYQLGIFYQMENDTLSFKWFTLAARGGISDAHHILGIFYQEGRGIDRDYSRAMEFYEEATSKDHEEAMYRLAQMYLHGKGAKANYKKAYEIFTMAAKQGHYLSRKFLNITKQPFSEIYEEIEPESSGFSLDSKNIDFRFPSTSVEFGYSIQIYKYIAEQGDIEAQYKLGLAFEESFSEPNYLEAVKWFTMSANNSHSNAMYRLGLLYEKGLGVCQNYLKAIQLYKKSSVKGNNDSSYRLATVYHHGKGVKIDPTKALQYYTDAACKGQYEAECDLGILFYKGELVQKNHLEALKWLTRSYLRGNHDVASYLYTMYEDNPLENYFYYRLFQYMKGYNSEYSFNPDNEKDGHASYTVGRFFLFGLGTRTDWLEAWRYITKAITTYGYPDKDHLIELILAENLDILSKLIDMGELDSHISVGKYYFFLADRYKTTSLDNDFTFRGINHPIPQDEDSIFDYYRKAIHYLSPLASDGDKEAQYYLGKMYLNGYGTVIDQIQAVTWFSEAAEQNHIEAQYELAILYFSGLYFDIDYATSLDYMKRAALSGHKKALFHFGWMYKYGLGIPKNEKEASKWFDVSLISMQAQYPHDFDKIALIKNIKNIELEDSDDTNVDANFNKPIKRLEMRAYKGDNEARYSLSQIFLQDSDYNMNPSKGIYHLRKGANQDHYLCQEELALLYYNGKFVRKNLRLASLWFKRAVEKRSAKSMLYLAQIYHCGLVHNNDFSGAFKLYQDIDGLYYPLIFQRKGLLYEYGDGLKMNHSMAYRLYIKSFNEGNFISGYNVALMYLYGKGVKQDYKEAISWLEKSLRKSTLNDIPSVFIEARNPQATAEMGPSSRTYSIVTYDELVGEILYVLGKIYFDGLGAQKNDAKANSYFLQADKKGNAKAKKHLDENRQ